MQTLSISQIARRAGVGIDTVRYYEREGLIPQPPRRPSGYRDYPLATVDRLRFIRRAKELGFTLSEITELLSLSADRRSDMRGVRRKAETKLAQVEQKLAELNRVRRGLKTLIAACPGHGELDHCPILAALGQE